MRLGSIRFIVNVTDPAGGTPRTVFTHADYDLDMDDSGTVLIVSKKTGTKVHANVPGSWQEAPRVVAAPPPADPDKSGLKPLRKAKP